METRVWIVASFFLSPTLNWISFFLILSLARFVRPNAVITVTTGAHSKVHTRMMQKSASVYFIRTYQSSHYSAVSDQERRMSEKAKKSLGSWRMNQLVASWLLVLLTYALYLLVTYLSCQLAKVAAVCAHLEVRAYLFSFPVPNDHLIASDGHKWEVTHFVFSHPLLSSCHQQFFLLFYSTSLSLSLFFFFFFFFFFFSSPSLSVLLKMSWLIELCSHVFHPLVFPLPPLEWLSLSAQVLTCCVIKCGFSTSILFPFYPFFLYSFFPSFSYSFFSPSSLLYVLLSNCIHRETGEKALCFHS